MKEDPWSITPDQNLGMNPSTPFPPPINDLAPWGTIQANPGLWKQLVDPPFSAGGSNYVQGTDAVPITPNSERSSSGFTKRERLCIDLKIPRTGDPVLDDIIREANLRDAALSGVNLENKDVVKYLVETITERVKSKLEDIDEQERK